MMDIGRLGVWASMDGMTATEAAEFARRVEALGYGALWVPESRGRNVYVLSAWLLAATKTLIVATGIANIYARDPQASASASHALNELSGGRFLLGLGVSTCRWWKASGATPTASTASRWRRCAPISRECAARPTRRRRPRATADGDRRAPAADARARRLARRRRASVPRHP